MGVVTKACEEIKTSKRFPELLGVVLAVGNKLNQNTKKGSAAGIKLKDLPKLAATKNNKGVTVLDYIVGNLLKARPELLKFGDDMKTVAPAQKVNVDVLRVDHKKLSQGLERIEREIEKDEELGEDAFEISLGPFKDKSTFQFEALDDKSRICCPHMSALPSFCLSQE